MADNDDTNNRKDKKNINTRVDSFMKPYVEAVDKFNRLNKRETKGLKEQERRWQEQTRYLEELQKNYRSSYFEAINTPEGSKERIALNRMEHRLSEAKERESTLGDDYVQDLTMHQLMLRERMTNSVREHASKNFSLKSLTPAARAHALYRAKTLVESGEVNESRILTNREKLAAKVETQRESLFQTIGEMNNTDEFDKEYLSKARKLEISKRRAATLEASEIVMKQMGMDAESVFKSGERRRDKILSNREDLALQYRVASGQTGSMKDESNKLDELTNKFLEAHQKFINALDESPEALEEFKKSVLEAGKSMDDQKKIVDEMNRQGMGGGNRGNVISTLDAVSGGLQAAGRLYMQGTVVSENQQMSQRAQFARIQNQMFMDHYSATQGDMMALAMVQSQAGGRSTIFGNEQGRDMLTGQTIDLAGAGISAGVDIAAASSDTVNPFGMVAKGAKEAARHAEALGMRGIDMTRGLSVNQARIEGFQTRYDLSRATNEIKGAAMQEFYNQSATNFAASSGFGGRRSDVFAQMQASRLGMAGLGVSTEEQAAMYQTAVGSMGDVFTKRGAAGMQATVNRAAEVGISGVTSAQDYLARIGQVAQVGGGDKQIEDILANAVARGVDDAKSFGDMVDSLSQLSGVSAASGVDVTGVVSRGMLGALDFTRNNGFDQRLNLNAVQQQMETVRGATADTGMTFASLIEQANLSNKFSDVSMAGRANIASVDIYQAKAMEDAIRSGDIAKAKTMSRRLGIGEIYFDEQGNVRKDAIDRASELVNTKERKIDSNISVLTGSSAASERIRKSKNRSPAEEAALTATGFGAEGLESLRDEGFSKGSLKGLEGDAASAQLGTKVAPAIGRARLSGAGESIGGGLGEIAQQMASIATSLEPLKNMAKSSEAAGAMRLDTGSFDASVKDFDKAVQMLIKAIGEKGGPGSSIVPTTVETTRDYRGNLIKNSSRVMPGR